MISWVNEKYGTALGGLLAVNIEKKYNNFITGQVWDILIFGNWPNHATLAPNFMGSLDAARVFAEDQIKKLLEKGLDNGN